MSENDKNDLTFFGRTNFHDKRNIFGIREADRFAHMYILGKTGTGKSTLLETLVRQDIETGNGLMLLDPHGDMAERIVTTVPQHRTKDLIYFNVPDTSRPLGFNPMERSPLSSTSLTVSNLLEVFKSSGPTFGDRAWNTYCVMRSSRSWTSQRRHLRTCSES